MKRFTLILLFIGLLALSFWVGQRYIIARTSNFASSNNEEQLGGSSSVESVETKTIQLKAAEELANLMLKTTGVLSLEVLDNEGQVVASAVLPTLQDNSSIELPESVIQQGYELSARYIVLDGAVLYEKNIDLQSNIEAVTLD